MRHLLYVGDEDIGFKFTHCCFHPQLPLLAASLKHGESIHIRNVDTGLVQASINVVLMHRYQIAQAYYGIVHGSSTDESRNELTFRQVQEAMDGAFESDSGSSSALLGFDFLSDHHIVVVLSTAAYMVNIASSAVEVQLTRRGVLGDKKITSFAVLSLTWPLIHRTVSFGLNDGTIMNWEPFRKPPQHLQPPAPTPWSQEQSCGEHMAAIMITGSKSAVVAVAPYATAFQKNCIVYATEGGTVGGIKMEVEDDDASGSPLSPLSTAVNYQIAFCHKNVHEKGAATAFVSPTSSRIYTTGNDGVSIFDAASGAQLTFVKWKGSNLSAAITDSAEVLRIIQGPQRGSLRFVTSRHQVLDVDEDRVEHEVLLPTVMLRHVFQSLSSQKKKVSAVDVQLCIVMFSRQQLSPDKSADVATVLAHNFNTSSFRVYDAVKHPILPYYGFATNNGLIVMDELDKPQCNLTALHRVVLGQGTMTCDRVVVSDCSIATQISVTTDVEFEWTPSSISLHPVALRETSRVGLTINVQLPTDSVSVKDVLVSPCGRVLAVICGTHLDLFSIGHKYSAVLTTPNTLLQSKVVVAICYVGEHLLVLTSSGSLFCLTLAETGAVISMRAVELRLLTRSLLGIPKNIFGGRWLSIAAVSEEGGASFLQMFAPREAVDAVSPQIGPPMKGRCMSVVWNRTGTLAAALMLSGEIIFILLDDNTARVHRWSHTLHATRGVESLLFSSVVSIQFGAPDVLLVVLRSGFMRIIRVASVNHSVEFIPKGESVQRSIRWVSSSDGCIGEADDDGLYLWA